VNLIKTVSLQDKVADANVSRITYRMEMNRSQILLALQHHPAFEYSKLHDHATTLHLNAIAENTDRINKLWTAYFAGIKSADEKKRAEALAGKVSLPPPPSRKTNGTMRRRSC
jgi:phytoene dehydrogenase-like protein